MEPCGTCSQSYSTCFSSFYNENQKAIDFFRSHGVLPRTVKCPNCNTECKLRKEQHSWRCHRTFAVRKRKKRVRCGYTVSDYKGTFLDSTNLPAWKILLFINHWLSKFWNRDAVLTALGISKHTSLNWRSFCCEVALFWLNTQESIGSAGVSAEVKEWIRSPATRPVYLKQYHARNFFIKAFTKDHLHHFLVNAARLYKPLRDRHHQPRAKQKVSVDEDDSTNSKDGEKGSKEVEKAKRVRPKPKTKKVKHVAVSGHNSIAEPEVEEEVEEDAEMREAILPVMKLELPDLESSMAAEIKEEYGDGKFIEIKEEPIDVKTEPVDDVHIGEKLTAETHVAKKSGSNFEELYYKSDCNSLKSFEVLGDNNSSTIYMKEEEWIKSEYGIDKN